MASQWRNPEAYQRKRLGGQRGPAGGGLQPGNPRIYFGGRKTASGSRVSFSSETKGRFQPPGTEIPFLLLLRLCRGGRRLHQNSSRIFSGRRSTTTDGECSLCHLPEHQP